MMSAISADHTYASITLQGMGEAREECNAKYEKANVAFDDDAGG
jgi:hypothetical protein